MQPLLFDQRLSWRERQERMLEILITVGLPNLRKPCDRHLYYDR
ncbi:MAG: hypothetical protein ACTXOO_02155 [Sodalis sp. (in: enterobacteria)]